MKKLFTIAFVTFSLSCYSQIKVTETKKPELIGEYRTMGTLFSKIEKFESDVCVFTYKDGKYTQIDEYKSFNFRYSDLQTLYNMFTNFDGINKGDEKTVDLEDGGKLFFKYNKSMGKMYAEVIHYDRAGVGGSIYWLPSKQADKLFGIKK